MLILLIGLMILQSLCYAQSEQATPVKVSGERVNLRARPDPNAEVVGQVSRNQILTAKSFQDEWVEVAAPDSVDVWVHKEFVANNRVSADRLYVRGGPGINWQSVGQMVRDEPIVVRGEFGEWFKIAPPPNCSLWVSRKYIEVMQPEKKAPSPPAEEPLSARATTKPTPEQTASAAKPSPAPRVPREEQVVVVASPTVAPSVEPVAGATAPPPPPDLTLIPLDGQGRAVQREGTLRLAGFVIGRPSRYRLVQQDGNRIQTLCYVRGNNSQLASLLGRRVLIRGREYWVRGVKDSVLIPEEIVPYAKP
jgi:uncharacterized protein YgiM (DUF1202 family)